MLNSPEVSAPLGGHPSKVQCHQCHLVIEEAHFLAVDGQHWHEDCLRCACCDARLAELDKICYVKANMALCKRDYLRLYGTTGLCAVCQGTISAYEYVMRARANVYHLDCFSCQRCHLRFCVGDKFYLHNNQILCEPDYLEAVWMRGVPIPTPVGPHLDPGTHFDGISGVKGHTKTISRLDDSSSGYGSPSPLTSAHV